MSEDRTITCSDCGQSFTFTAEEQSFYAERGFQEPKRCKACRDARKSRGPGGGRSGGGDRGRPPRGDRPQKQLYPATCAECGAATEVPFQPKADRPVYCRDCFKTIRERGGGGGD